MRGSNGKRGLSLKTSLWSFCVGVMILGVVPAWAAPTFSYTTDFESATAGSLPPGWAAKSLTLDYTMLADTARNPKVTNADPADWGNVAYANHSVLSPTTNGVVNYAVPWSGGKRFTIFHPIFAGASGGENWCTGTVFTGKGATYSGTYPMNLQSGSFQASFDLAIRSGNNGNRGHGLVFEVQPVADVDHVRFVGRSYGREGYEQNGFAVEFDFFNNQTGWGSSGYGDPGASADGISGSNHVGINLYRLWNVGQGTGTISVASLKTDYEFLGSLAIPRMYLIGDNNQPMHITVFYNDPNHGGLGKVQVYLYVDPATKADGDPPVPSTQTTPFSYGMTADTPPVPKNGGLGELVVEACVGAWPSTGAAFGFTAGRSGSSFIGQVDNFHAETNAITGTPPPVCTVTYPDLTTYGYPNPAQNLPYNPGTSVSLATEAPVQADTTGMTQLGWDVTSYPLIHMEPGGSFPTRMDLFKGSVRWCRDHSYVPGAIIGSKTAEPDINYFVAGAAEWDGNLSENRFPPGMIEGQTWVGILAKGWIYFPVGDHDYDLTTNCDNDHEVRIGNTILSTGDGLWGTGVNGGACIRLHVNQAGVYPIQILWYDYGGGAYVEFYRRVDAPMIPFLLVGNTTQGVADQPVVFGLRNGVTAPDHIDEYPSTPNVLGGGVNLSPTQKVAGTPTGVQGFNIKTVWVRYPGGLNNAGISIAQNGAYGDVRQTALGFLDTLDNLVPGTVAPVVNFRGVGETDGVVPGGVDIPGISVATAGQYGVRAEGFASFPTAGTYYVGIQGDDDIYLRFGNQTVANSACCNNLLVTLNVLEAGTYPVRVELIGVGYPNSIDFYEGIAGLGLVSVNDSRSTVKVWTAATSGDFPWTTETDKWVIPAARKIADSGRGKDLGWNGTLVKSSLPTANNMGITAALVHKDLLGADVSAYPTGYATPLYANITDNGGAPAGNFNTDATTVAGQQTADILVNTFLAGGSPVLTAADNDNYVIRLTGYVEFPAPGYYGFNTNTDDGMITWMAGIPTAFWNLDSGPGDNTPCFFRVEQAGIYDICVDYYESAGGSEFELVQYLPDGITDALPNDANTSPKKVKVYRTLLDAPANTTYADPGMIPLSAKVAELHRHGDSGARFQRVQASFISGDGNNSGVGQDKFKTLAEAHELLASVLDGVPSYSQHGALAQDETVTTINWSEDSTAAGYEGTRTTGLLALTKGGHIFELYSDDGSMMWIGDMIVGQTDPQHGVINVTFYVNAPADGLYPFTIEHIAGGPPNQLTLNEVLVNATKDGFDRVLVNTANAAKIYVNLTTCAYPSVDGDHDGDVDQVDFGVFQLCFTGPTAPTGGLTQACRCFDKNQDGIVDATDFGAFMDCLTGPDINWTQELKPNCQP